MKIAAAAILAFLTGPAFAASDCKAIEDAAQRLACFDAASVAPVTAGTLEFETVKNAMNARYTAYFAHHKTSLIGSKTVGDRKLFYIRVPDPNPSLQILASCLHLDAGGGWMCTLVPNYGTFGALPLPIKAN